jgi:REP element-mobilizing transposase RayT
MADNYNPELHQRRSIRLKGYDYSEIGAYYVTICTWRRECLLGNIVDRIVHLNEYGTIINKEWSQTEIIRSTVEVDRYIIMPNHFHGILVINNGDGRGTLQRAPTFEQFGKPTSNSIPTIIRLFKSTTTKQINQLRNTPEMPVWQRNYYEHVIRNKDELNRIREYIVNNPLQWEKDENNPVNW